MIKVPMTVIGAAKLKEELDKLKKVERPRIIQDIAEARAHGDLSENAEYHAAREQQSFAEGRIKEIEAKISTAQVIDPTTLNADGRVVFGATLDLLNESTDEKVTYQIVGDDEANIEEGKISVNSPIARALIGKEDGDVVDITTPGGVHTYEILEVRYK